MERHYHVSSLPRPAQFLSADASRFLRTYLPSFDIKLFGFLILYTRLSIVVHHVGEKTH